MMTISDAQWCRRYFESFFIEQIDAFQACLLNKALPSFDNLGEEFKKIFEEEYERSGERLAGPDNFIEPADRAEAAQDKAIDYYYTMSNMKDALVGFFTAGLFHLFEQQLFLFYNAEVLKYGEEKAKISPSEWTKLKERFKAEGIDLDSLNSAKKIKELRLVANVIKHAEGRSAQELRELRPDFFRPDEEAPFYEIEAKMPLAGEDIEIPLKDFKQYCEDVKEFWRELGERLIKDGKESPA